MRFKYKRFVENGVIKDAVPRLGDKYTERQFGESSSRLTRRRTLLHS